MFILTWNQKMKPAEEKAAWTKYLDEFGEPPRIPTPVEVEAKQLVSPNQRSDLRDKAKAERAVDRGGGLPGEPHCGGRHCELCGLAVRRLRCAYNPRPQKPVERKLVLVCS